ncbi:hypothetical protein LZ30DRAFT_701337 [Colletotrichum cereale]|nr:hypothetical protein LZ30DRAFT_701337 [Colletotrichum cereale]
MTVARASFGWKHKSFITWCTTLCHVEVRPKATLGPAEVGWDHRRARQHVVKPDGKRFLARRFRFGEPGRHTLNGVSVGGMPRTRKNRGTPSIPHQRPFLPLFPTAVNAPECQVRHGPAPRSASATQLDRGSSLCARARERKSLPLDDGLSPRAVMSDRRRHLLVFPQNYRRIFIVLDGYVD